MLCDTCGKDLAIGEWPFCPHGEVGSFAEHGDEIDYVDHNLGPKPIRIRSKEERRRLMKERGLVDAPYVEHKHTDTRSQTVNWCAHTDPYTAKNAAELLERAFKQRDYGIRDGMPIDLDVHTMDKSEVRQYLRDSPKPVPTKRVRETVDAFKRSLK